MVSKSCGLDRSKLKLDLQPQNDRSLSSNTPGSSNTNESIMVTPLSAPARSHYFVDQSRANAVISRRGLEAWKRAIVAAAPGTTMCYRNRDKSPIESLQRAWEERKRKESETNSVAVTPRKKSVSFFLLRKPASSIRKLYQRATSTETATSPWPIVNAAFTTGPSPTVKDQRLPSSLLEGTPMAQTIRTTQL